MSHLAEVTCTEHTNTGFQPHCPRCEHVLHVAVLRYALDASTFNRPRVVTGMLAVASPTIARKAFYALGAAMVGKELTEEDRAMLQLLKDLMQDCVEKVQ